MAFSKLLPFDSSCKTPGISGIRVGPRLHLRLCAELLDLAGKTAVAGTAQGFVAAYSEHQQRMAPELRPRKRA